MKYALAIAMIVTGCSTMPKDDENFVYLRAEVQCRAASYEYGGTTNYCWSRTNSGQVISEDIHDVCFRHFRNKYGSRVKSGNSVREPAKIEIGMPLDRPNVSLMCIGKVSRKEIK